MDDREDDQALGLVKEALAQSRPRTVRQLVAGIRVKNSAISEERILSAIDALERNGAIGLKTPGFKRFHDFFLDISWNSDFFVVVMVATTSGLLYLVATGFPWRLLQVIPGALLVFYLPGHSFLKVVLASRDLQSLERIVLEIGTSIVLIMLMGLLLNFSGFGLLSASALASVTIFNIVMALWASFRHYSTMALARSSS